MDLYLQIIVHRPQGGAHAHTNSAAAFAPATTRRHPAPPVGEGAWP